MSIPGVTFCARRKQWRAHHTQRFLGWFKTEAEAEAVKLEASKARPLQVRYWTAEEDARLGELWAVTPTMMAVAKALGRDENSVYVRAKKLGLPGRAAVRAGLPQLWSADRVDQLRRLHGEGLTDTRIAEGLGPDFNESTVKRKRQQLALTGGPAAPNWTAADDAALTEFWNGPPLTYQAIGERIGRTGQAVELRRKLLGLPARPVSELKALAAPAAGPASVFRRWTDERVAVLRTHFADDLSAGESARLLGPDFTAAMVIGKRHRMGLKTDGAVWVANMRRLTPKPNSEPKRLDNRTAVAPANLSRRVEPPRPSPPLVSLTPPANPIRLTELGPHTCRWPVTGYGEALPDTPEHLFCGRSFEPQDHRPPYCPEHHRRSRPARAAA